MPREDIATICRRYQVSNASVVVYTNAGPQVILRTPFVRMRLRTDLSLESTACKLQGGFSLRATARARFEPGWVRVRLTAG